MNQSDEAILKAGHMCPAFFYKNFPPFFISFNAIFKLKDTPMIEYKINFPITIDQFIDILNKSTLCERRPMHDIECLKGMVENSNLTITAWHAGTLIGIARSVTDFHFACYLSDLAVDQKYQHKGVGKKLQIITQDQLGPNCKLILIAAPAANEYYRKLGYTQNDRCWVLSKNKKLSA